MYYVAVTNDENKYYRTYSKCGSISLDDCICVQVDELPVESEYNKNLFYKLIESIVQVSTQVSSTEEIQATDNEGNLLFEEDGITPIMTTQTVIDEETGNVVYDTIYTDTTVYCWEFDESAYNTWVEEESNKAVELTTEEKLVQLDETITSLQEMYFEMLIEFV